MQPPKVPVDEARLLPHLRERSFSERRDLRRSQALALIEARPTPTSRVTKAEPGDLRGIPAIGRGVGGVIAGTSPEREAIRRLSK